MLSQIIDITLHQVCNIVTLELSEAKYFGIHPTSPSFLGWAEGHQRTFLHGA